MQRLSISKAWEETAAFIKAESRILLPIVLALFVLPPVASAMLAPPTVVGGMPQPGPWMLVVVISFLVRLIGLLAVTRLAIGPPSSVGQTLRDASRRILPIAGLTALMVLPAMLIATPLLSSILAAPSNPPPAAAVGLFLLSLALFVASVRLSFSIGVAMTERGGPIAIARRSFALTRGAFWRLFGMILLLLVTLAVLTSVVQAVVGSLLLLTVGKPAPLSVSLLILLLILQIVDAAVTVVMTVLLARAYAQRAAASDMGHGAG